MKIGKKKLKKIDMKTIIKQKGDGYVCLRTEMEKPEKIIPTNDGIGSYDHYYSAKHKQWLESFKPYDIRKEDEEKFIQVTKESWTKLNPNKQYFWKLDLSEGIEIDSKLVRIESEYKIWLHNGELLYSCKTDENKNKYEQQLKSKKVKYNLEVIEYAVLVSPEEESNEDVEEVIKTMFINTVSSKKTYFGMDDFVEKLLSQFTITRKNK